MDASTMIGLAVTELGKRVELREFPVPELDDNSVIIQTQYSCVSIGTEMWIANGKRKDYGEPPFIMGYQSTGVVTQTGSNVDHVRIGDIVAMFGGHAHSQYVKGRKERTFKLNGSASAKPAAMFVQPSVVAHAYNIASIRVGDVVYISGQGFIGQCAAKLARMHGAYVITSDISPARLEFSRRYCADWVIDASKGKPSDLIKQRFPEGVHVGVESTGFSTLVDDVMTSCKTYGKFIFLGWYPGNIEYNFNIPHVKQITAYYPSGIGPHTVQEAVIHMIESGTLSMEELISHHIHWVESSKLYNQLFTSKRDNFNVILIDWTT